MPYVNNQHFCGRPFELKLNGNADVPVAAGQGRHYADAIRTTVVDVAGSITTVAATGGTSGSLKLLDLPEGQAIILGVAGTITFTSTVASDGALVFSIGTAAAGINNVQLDGTEANILPSGGAAIAANTSGAKVVQNSTGAFNLDGVTTPIDAILNVASSSATVQTLTVTGKIAITWICLGDNVD
jgi:hypothetical protein